MNEGLTTRICLRIISHLLAPVSIATHKTLHMKLTDKKSQELKEEFIDRHSNEKNSKNNAVEQIQALLNFKESIVNDCDDSLFLSISHRLAEPLRKPANERTDNDNHILETILHILSNLTSIASVGNHVTLGEKISSVELQCKLLKKYEVCCGV